MRSPGSARNRRGWSTSSSPPATPARRREPNISNVDIAADDIDALLDFARREHDRSDHRRPRGPAGRRHRGPIHAAGARCFGPTRAAARLEGSKAYTKDFLRRHGIPTAGYATFTAADFDPAFVRAQRLPLVVKADGLAAGKGVIICDTHDAAIEPRAACSAGSFGAAGNTS